ncbi:MAG: hypothetical protein LQ351_001121 [Letrouitia transgressa]|nr:MAG: hypothetical protein LQ351_001121 [Letrouitia transgressa]
MSSHNDSREEPSLAFKKAVEKFTKTLSAKQKKDFTHSTLEDVYDAIKSIQDRRGSDQTLRNMARVQSFLEAMDEYRKVIEAFLNCTPFLGYVWGPIRFILLVADAWVESLDAILDAYQKIQERLPAFMKYKALFETNPELSKALELYFCDILDFHTHAMKFLNRRGLKGWQKLFDSSWKTFDTHFRRILDSLDRHKGLIESEKGTLTLLEAQTTREIAEACAKETAQREARDKVKVLIERLDSTDYKRDQLDACEQRRQKRSDVVCNPLLYIHGIPGAGKTVLSSIIIERLLEERHEPVLYFYCKYNQPRKNRFNDVLSSLVAQLVQHDNALANCLYDKCSSKDQLGVLGALETLAETAFECQDGCYVVVDGLDECQSKEAERIISWLISRNKATQPLDSSPVRLLFVGQRTDVVLRMLAPAVPISLDGPEHQADIQEYVQVAAGKVKDEFGINPYVEAQIVARVTAAATSMFLFAKLVMENLLNQVTQKDVIQELEPSVFPVDLQGAYRRVCETVFQEGPQKKAVIKIIGSIICATRELTWREVQAIFYIDPQRSTYLISQRLISVPLQHLEMANFCLDYLLSSPLASWASEDETEQRTKDGYFAFHDYASVYCFNHLSYAAENCAEGNDTVQKDLLVRCKSFVERYKIPRHSRFSDQEDIPVNIAQFVGSISDNARDRNKRFDIEWRTLRIRRVLEDYVESFQSSTGTYDAALDMYGASLPDQKETLMQIGMIDLIRAIIAAVRFQSLGFESENQLEKHRKSNHAATDDAVCAFPNLRNINGDTIFKAAARGDVTAVKVFLDQGAAIDHPSRPQGGETPLILAVRNSQLNVCKLLLERGADVNFSGPKGRRTSAIHAAVISGNIEMLQCLLATKDVHPNQPDGSGNTPLTTAVISGNIKMLQYLLATKDVNPNQVDGSGNTPLTTAVTSGNIEMLQCLLATKDVYPNQPDGSGNTPLTTAVISGNIEMLQCLLATKDVNPNQVGWYGNAPLTTAVTSGNIETLQCLLATKDVHPNQPDGSGNTPLTTAVTSGNIEMLQCLLATKDVNPNQVDGSGNTPLMTAAKNGLSTMVKLLIDSERVDVNRINYKNHCALGLSSSDDVCDILIKYTNDVTILHTNMSPRSIKGLLRTGTGEALLKESDERGDGLLHAALDIHDYESAKLLIQSGRFKLDFVNSLTGLTPLFRCVYSDLIDDDARGQQDREDIFEMLVASGKVNLDAVDKEGWTILGTAVEIGNIYGANVLLATGRVAVNIIDPEGRTSFSRAVELDYKKIIQSFLATGQVDINTIDATGKTVLGYALDPLELEVAQWLLKYQVTRLNGGIDEETWNLFDAAERLHEVGAIDEVDFQMLCRMKQFEDLDIPFPWNPFEVKSEARPTQEY